MTPRFLAVEGPIGVGKSTLARHLADALGATVIADPDADNPYLEAFYADPSSTALHAQLHFLLSRLEVLDSIGDVREEGACAGARIVSDFLIDKDRLFAELTLESREWAMYERLHERLLGAGAGEADLREATPDLVIYLQAPLERLVERIERRGRSHERRIDSRYLQRLANAYERLFHDWSASPLLIVNTADMDPANSPAETRRLLERIDRMDGGRHYFNPGVPAD